MTTQVLSPKSCKYAMRLLQQVRRRTELNNGTSAQYDDAITVKDRVEPMRYREHCTVREALSNHLLNKSVCLVVDRGCCFIHHQHFRLAEQSAGNTNELWR